MPKWSRTYDFRRLYQGVDAKGPLAPGRSGGAGPDHLPGAGGNLQPSRPGGKSCLPWRHRPVQIAPVPGRYSEDIDLVLMHPDPIGPVMSALQEKLNPWLGNPKRKQGEGR